MIATIAVAAFVAATAVPGASTQPAAPTVPTVSSVPTAAAAKLDVRTLQNRLARQGFWPGPIDGQNGLATKQAVLAAQKAAGLTRDGIAGPATLTAIRKGIRVTPKSKTGHVIEIDKKRQLLIVADRGRATMILNTSTGNGQLYRTTGGGTARATTPTGHYRVQRQITGWHTAPLGRLYAPKYFTGGYAIHGSTSIPAWPASHGCVRVSVPAMDHLWQKKLAPIGAHVNVY